MTETKVDYDASPRLTQADVDEFGKYEGESLIETSERLRRESVLSKKTPEEKEEIENAERVWHAFLKQVWEMEKSDET